MSLCPAVQGGSAAASAAWEKANEAVEQPGGRTSAEHLQGLHGACTVGGQGTGAREKQDLSASPGGAT